MFARRWSLAPLCFTLTITSTPLQCDQKPEESWQKDVQSEINAGRLKEARAELEEAKARFGPSYATLLSEARILYAERDYKESLNVLDSCLRLRHDDPEVYKLVAFNAVRVEKFAVAEQALATAAKLAPNDSVIHFHLGTLYYTESRFLQAQSELERSVSEDERFLPAQLFLGLALEETDQEAEAIHAYRKGIALDEARADHTELPYLYLGRLLYRLGRLPEALVPLRKATNLRASSSEAWILLGKTLAGLRQEPEAVLSFERAVDLDARNPEAHYLLSREYLAMHREQDAKRELVLFRSFKDKDMKTNDGRRSSP